MYIDVPVVSGLARSHDTFIEIAQRQIVIREIVCVCVWISFNSQHDATWTGNWEAYMIEFAYR